MGREEGGGFRMGNTCIPVQIHVDIWQYQYNILKLKNKRKNTYIYTHIYGCEEWGLIPGSGRSLGEGSPES